MNKKLVLLISIFIITLAVGAVIAFMPSSKVLAPSDIVPGTATTTATTTPVTTTTQGIPDLITITAPAKDASITSPLSVTGSARGTWYFEASFPVKILDSKGKVIGQGPAQAQGDWMTTEFVPFTASITYTAQPAGSRGTVVFMKDNPSGDPERDQSVSVPITFK